MQIRQRSRILAFYYLLAICKILANGVEDVAGYNYLQFSIPISIIIIIIIRQRRKNCFAVIETERILH